MNKRYALYEKLKYPIEIIFIGCLLLGIGNIFSNPVFGFADLIDNSWLEAVNEMLMRTGRFIVVNFPLILLLGSVSDKNGTTAVSALTGYVSFLSATIFFTRSDLNSNAYSSILGMSVSGSQVSWISGTVHYPLQTGIIGTLTAALMTYLCTGSMRRSRRKNNEIVFTNNGAVIVRTILLCFLAGAGISFVWPYVVQGINWIISFISRDTSNPVRLAVYGIVERVLSVLGLGTLIRQPFWFGTNGGSWTNIAGQTISGDVSIWTAKMNQSSVLNGTTGRFITPYYLLNIFAVPGLTAGICSMETDKKKKRRKRVLMAAGMVASALCGTLLPAELTMILLCPLLYVFHLLMVGLMYHLTSVLNLYLGYQTSSSVTQGALPGTLSEMLTYTSNSSLSGTVGRLALMGIAVFAVYYLASRLYFRKFAAGLFNPPYEKKTADDIVSAMGGINNITDVQASASELRIHVYDISEVNADALNKTGTSVIYEGADNEVILHYGAACWMLRRDILDKRRALIRDV